MNRGFLTLVLALASVGVSVGCASGGTARRVARALAAADARVLEGCYDCLRQARAVYAQFAGSRYASTAITRLFETNLLLALREKELALDWRASMEQARALTPRLPPSLQSRRLLDMVARVLPDPSGIPPKRLDVMRSPHETIVRTMPAELMWLARAPLTPVVRDYVALALDCSYDWRPESPGQEPVDSIRKRHARAPGAPPLTVYRSGICLGVDTTILMRARAMAPAFDEAAYYLAKHAILSAGSTGGDDARELLERAYARFPRAPGVTHLFGQLHMVTANCPEALRYYEETIAIDSAHDHAWLDRTICLTNLRRDSSAIESATRLIALETAATPRGYYWRALNRLRRKELTQARSDIETAKSLATASDVLTLAGMIEHDQDDLPVAERDLRSARAMFGGEANCTAAWYLGRVLMKGQRWAESAGTFEAAMLCYDRKVLLARGLIAMFERQAHGNPAFKAKRIAMIEAEIVEQRAAYHASAFNGASANVRAGNVARARELADIAARDPKLAEQVAKLREALGGPKG